MKKIILLSSLICLVVLFANLFAGNPVVYQGTISVSTTTAIARNELKNRRKLIFENISNTYDAYVSTYSISYANRTRGDRIVANGGRWTDENYWLYISTWYAVSESGTITLQYKESE